MFLCKSISQHCHWNLWMDRGPLKISLAAIITPQLPTPIIFWLSGSWDSTPKRWNPRQLCQKLVRRAEWQGYISKSNSNDCLTETRATVGTPGINPSSKYIYWLDQQRSVPSGLACSRATFFAAHQCFLTTSLFLSSATVWISSLLSSSNDRTQLVNKWWYSFHSI